jgi:hypothetical protein
MNRREWLRARLSRLCEDVRELHARARGFETIDACMDIESVYAVEALYEAYATRVIDATKEKLCATLASNERRAARLCEGTQTFASKARGMDRPRDVCAWNFPRRRRASSSHQCARDSTTWRKARVLRRVETSLRLERQSKASDELAGSTTKPGTEEETSFLYEFDELAHPRRMMTQCVALAARAADARERFNERHASIVAARAEIINHLRSIDRRVNALRRTHSETLRSEMRFDSDVLMQWWESPRVREVVSGEEALDENEAVHAERVVAMGSDPLNYQNDAGMDADRVLWIHGDDAETDACHDDEISKLREMMGRDISNDAGEIDAEACDNRQNFDSSASLRTEIVRPEFIPDDLCGNDDARLFDLDNDEEWKARMGLNAEQTARLAEYGNALRLRRKAMDEQSMSIRGEIRNLVQQAKESTSAFDAKLCELARERKEVEIDVLLYDLQRVRLAIRLHDASVAGDFAGIGHDDGEADGGKTKTWIREMDRREALKREQESRLEMTLKRVNDVALAAKSATRAFRREIQDNPASRVHLEAMLKLYHHQGDVVFKQPSSKADDAHSSSSSSSSCGVFPQGLHEQWWDRLVSARAKRSAHERDLAEARAAHERETRALRAIESELDIARKTAEECAREDAKANMKRRARRRDVDCPIRLVRGRVETSAIDAATSIQTGDLTLVSRCAVERLNTALADAVSAANRVQSQNVAARDDIDRVRWEIDALSLRCDDVTARTTEVALLRVTKRLQSFLFHVNGECAAADSEDSDDDDVERVARRRSSKSSAASEVASLVARLDRDARLHAARVARTRDGVRALHRRAQSLRRRIAASASA